jgi:MFS transporter, FHS family, Na+ dependent glucose transporter 1
MESIAVPDTTATPTGRSLLRAQTASYYGAFIALGLVAAVLGPTLPSLQANTRTQLQDISLLFTMRALGYLLGSLQGGLLYDRRRGHPIIAIVLVGIAGLLAVVPLIKFLWVLVAIFLLIGVGEGMLDVGGNTLLVWGHGASVGPYMNGLHFCFGLGAFLAPIIVAQIVALGGASMWSYWVLAALIAPVALALLRLPSPAARHSVYADVEVRIDYWLVAFIVLFFVLYVGAEVGFSGWVFSYAAALRLTNTESAAYLTSAFWGALTLGRLLAIPLAARLRPRTILLADLAGCLLSVGCIVLWPGSMAVLWLGAAGLGLAMASIFPTMLSFAARRMPTTGKITSWFLVGASFGAMSLPWLIGQLFEPLGPRIAMIVILIDLLAACAVFLLLIRYAGRPNVVEGKNP